MTRARRLLWLFWLGAWTAMSGSSRRLHDELLAEAAFDAPFKIVVKKWSDR